MVGQRWRHPAAPGRLALGALLLVGVTTGTGAGRPWFPQPCAGGVPALTAASRHAAAPALADLGNASWFRLEPRLDADGVLAGQALTFGTDRDGSGRSMELPAESFAAGPFGRVILVGADDGTTSRLFALDTVAGCTSAIADDASVIRRATIRPDGLEIDEMRVDRRTRADLGIWRRRLDAGEPVTRILAPIGTDDRFGRTWATELSWSSAGDRLVVQSCGGSACRTRVLDPIGGRVHLVDDPGLGPVIGLAEDHLVSHGACRGEPCPVVSTDLRTGERRVIAALGGVAVVASDGGSARVVAETWLPDGSLHLRRSAVDGSDTVDLGAVPAGLRLGSAAASTGSGTTLPADWILLAPDGRFPIQAERGESFLRRVSDGRSVNLLEVTR